MQETLIIIYQVFLPVRKNKNVKVTHGFPQLNMYLAFLCTLYTHETVA
jgi:hypothetical protein